SLAAGASATDHFRYTVTDAAGLTSTATVTITITGQNDTPGVEDVSGTVLNEGQVTRVAGCDSEPDVGGSHSFTIDTTTNATKGKVTDNGDGTFTYDPNGAFAYLAAGASATDHFRYTVTDAAGLTSTAMVTITVTGQNDTPSLNPIADRNANEG